VSIDHYENFPVASLMCPRALRLHVAAIYAYARTADDLADEGAAPPEQRLDDLNAYEADLRAIAAGNEPSARWPEVFEPLAQTLRRHRLPLPLLTDLLSAFKQDVTQHHYADRNALLDYCRRSANPVGRLLLHMYGVHDAAALHQSDAICTALQLANFWQDLSIDTRHGRLYIPHADCDQFGVSASELLAGSDSAQVHTLVAEMVAWTRAMMRSGAPLAHRLGRRVGWELRLVVQGGLRILSKIERMQCASLLRRPKLHWYDAPVLAWHALWMRERTDRLVQERT